MLVQQIKEVLDRLEKTYGNCITNGIDLSSINTSKTMYDFKEKKKQYYLDKISQDLQMLQSTGLKLSSLNQFEIKTELKINQFLGLIKELDLCKKDCVVAIEKVSSIKKLVLELNISEKPKVLATKDYPIYDPNLPLDVLPDLNADINEIKKCFGSECFRSCVILCGRVLEIGLHKKYYDATGFDILEKNPGIGLGNLVARLREKQVELDPGITQQIHLVNQVRIFSVHKKKEVFKPTKEQTYAIILYTFEILKKLFI
ncbi:hypothetical protein HN587_02510 [Candidatus Woesearchaeota archaeon]|jgi:hypothetical protein|nr:hypothetical protein [Candidatus Woesearchaeota archaeon]